MARSKPAAAMPFIDLRAQRARIGPRLDAAIARVLASGRFVLGEEVAAFEGELAAFAGAGHAVGCANGTDALVLALRALGIGPGHAVFVPAFTFVATAEAPVLVGATPVFVDIGRDGFNMDPESLARAVDWAKREPGLRPAAAIPVDLFGQPADYGAIAALAEAHGLALIADAAQSFGASRSGRRVGTLAPVTTTSFFPAKPLGCYGDGGAVLSEDAALADVVRSIALHGQGADRYEHARIGMNSRLDALQAAILREKLRILDDEIAARGRLAARYSAGLPDGARAPATDAGTRSAWAQYTVTLDRGGAARDRVRRRMAEAGVPSAVYYPLPLHRQPPYADAPVAPGGLPVSEDLCARVLSLPMHPYLSDTDADRVLGALRAAVFE